MSLPCPCPSTTPTAVSRAPADRHVGEEGQAPPRRGVRPGLAGVALGDQGVEVGERAGDRQRHAGHRDDLAEDREAHRLLEDAQLVGGGGDRARIEPAGIGVGRVVHPERAGLGVHLGDEAGLAARHLGGEHPGDVVAGGDQQRLEQLALGQLLAGRHRHDRLVLGSVLGLVLRLGRGDVIVNPSCAPLSG